MLPDRGKLGSDFLSLDSPSQKQHCSPVAGSLHLMGIKKKEEEREGIIVNQHTLCTVHPPFSGRA